MYKHLSISDITAEVCHQDYPQDFVPKACVGCIEHIITLKMFSRTSASGKERPVLCVAE